MAAEHIRSDTSKRSGNRQGRPPATDAEDTRRRIMAAARNCFGAQGYRETTNRMIADMAGVTSATIYHYFESKQDLFMSVHHAIQSDIASRLEPIVAAELPLLELLDEILRVFHALIAEHPDYSPFNAAVRTEARRNPEIASARSDDQWRRLFRILAMRGVESGEVAPENARALQTVLAAVILGLVQHEIEASFADHAECLRAIGLLFRAQLVLPAPG